MRANRSVRAAGYPVQQTSVKREMGKKTVYVYVGRPVTEEERQDITVRVLGAVPNATDVVVYPLPGAAQGGAVPGDSAPRPNSPAAGQQPQPNTPDAAQQPQPNPDSQARPANPQAARL